jgi:hypothetical protein
MNAGVADAAAASASQITEDPVVALYRRYQEAEETSKNTNRNVDSLRAILTRCWGEFSDWKHDSNYLVFKRLLDESNQRVNDLCDLPQQMMATPATTLAGVRAKMRVGLGPWPFGDDYKPEWHEKAAFAYMTDALRLLDEMLGMSKAQPPVREELPLVSSPYM